ncbi:MAG: ABC transporter permease [Terriglobia bacterium]|jgi:putative ABC transport system permease protein
MNTLFQDLKYGLRMLAKNPGFTTVAILTLALGIGANTAIFSVVNGVLLRALPYKDAGRLVFVAATNRSENINSDVTSYPDFADWRAQNHVFSGLAAYRSQAYDLFGGGQPEQIRGVRVTEDLLPLLDEKPALGRAFLPEEYQRGKEHVVLLGDGLWRRVFGSDPGLVGKTLKLNDELYTVIGVMPPGFQFPPNERAALYTPLVSDENRSHGWLWAVGRLKPGIGLREARLEMDGISLRLQHQYPKSNKGEGVNVLTLRESVVGQMRPAFLVFICAVGLVLLIACANVANLMLSRNATRERELAVRAALGARRGRLVTQLLTESALLSLFGGVLGLALAYWGIDALVGPLMRRDLPIPRLDNIQIDGWVLGFTLLVSFLTSILFGLAPALSASRIELNESLKEGMRAVAGGLRLAHLRNYLVVAEVALALVLLVSAGLMIRSFLLLMGVQTGVDVHNVLVADVSLHAARYAQPHVRADFLQQVDQHLRTLPGVESASWVTDVPLSGDSDGEGFSILGQPDPESGKPREGSFNVVGPGYLRTLRIPLLRGRDFTDRDNEAGPGVGLINEAMARRFWSHADPIGQQISTDGKKWFEIIGVVGNVHQLGQAKEVSPEIYLSYLQDPVDWPYRSLIIRTAGDPMKLVKEVEQAVWSVNREMPISHIRPMEQVLAESVAQPRIFALLLGVFAGLALVLSAIGIYGVVAYSVAQRTHELGVRMALGAEPSDVFRLVVGQGMCLTLIGLGIGLGGALALTRFLRAFLFGVGPTDRVTFGLVALSLGMVALIACYIPARRATKVDPTVALRYE